MRRRDTLTMVLAIALVPVSSKAFAQEEVGACRAMAGKGCMDMSFTQCKDTTEMGVCHSSYYLRYTCAEPIRLRMWITDGNEYIHVMGEGYPEEIRQSLTWSGSMNPGMAVRGMECCDGDGFENCESDENMWD